MKKALVAIALVAIAALGFYLRTEIPYRIELGRRHHQIGQLWTFCKLYYCPKHGDHFPRDLNELKSLPDYKISPDYFDRAISEVELTSPGVSEDDPKTAYVVVFQEKAADVRGLRAVHEVGGAYGFIDEGDANSNGKPVRNDPHFAHPMMIGG